MHKVVIPSNLPSCIAKEIDNINHFAITKLNKTMEQAMLTRRKAQYSTKESTIQTAIEHYLMLQENLGRLLYIKNNSGAVQFQRPNGSTSYMRAGKKGSSDFIVFLDGGITLFMEVKNEKGKQSETQKVFEADVKRLGFPYCIVRSVEETDQILKQLIKSHLSKELSNV